jgi:acyl-CoA synthetase (AMP-forming)/AMP-acid ligase II
MTGEKENGADGGSEEVGYGKPPKSTRFRKGQSGDALPATPSGKVQKFRLREMLREGKL